MNTGYHRPTSYTVQDGYLDPVDRDLPIDGQLQDINTSRVYLFGDANFEEDGNLDQYEVEMPELRSRGPARKQPDTTTKVEEGPSYFEKALSDNDTLLGVALKYGCKVSELKRTNNLIRDQDFYGLKTVLIPVQRHGLLTELKEHQTNSDTHSADLGGGATAHNSMPDYGVIEDVDEEEYDAETDTEHRALLVRNLSIRDAFGTQGGEAASFLKRMDKDIKNIIQNANSRKDTLEEVRDTLMCKSIHPLRASRTIFDGIDCGMRWWSVVIVMLVLLLGCPLLYFLYFQYVKPSS